MDNSVNLNPIQTTWSFETAKEAVKQSTPYQHYRTAIKIIQGIGFTLAGVCLVAAAIQFSAVWLLPAAVLGIASFALFFLNAKFIHKEKQITVDQGLTKQVRAELAAEQLKNTLQTSSSYDFETTRNFRNDINTVYPLFVYPRFNPIKNEAPQFYVDDTCLKEQTVIDLLITAYEKGVILHLRSLEKITINKPIDIETKWKATGFPPEGKSHEALPEVKHSYQICKEFVTACLKKENLNIQKINRQLEALAIKYIDAHVEMTQAVKPPLSLINATTLAIHSQYGEMEKLDSLFKSINLDNIQTIQLCSYGFRIADHCFGHDDKWNTLLNDLQTTYPQITIIDKTADPQLNTSIWQEIKQPCGMWTTTIKELKEWQASRDLSSPICE